MYIYVDTCTQKQTCKQANKQTHIDTYIHPCMHALHAITYMHACMHEYVCKHVVFIYVRMIRHQNIHMCVCVSTLASKEFLCRYVL